MKPSLIKRLKMVILIWSTLFVYRNMVTKLSNIIKIVSPKSAHVGIIISPAKSSNPVALSEYTISGIITFAIGKKTNNNIRIPEISRNKVCLRCIIPENSSSQIIKWVAVRYCASTYHPLTLYIEEIKALLQTQLRWEDYDNTLPHPQTLSRLQVLALGGARNTLKFLFALGSLRSPPSYLYT